MQNSIRIFNRVRDNSHALYGVVSEMVLDIDDSTHAVASNLMHDPRISVARETAFLKEVGNCESVAGFQERNTQYREGRITKTHSPDFDGPANEDNRAASAERLLHVFFVNGLHNMFVWASEATPDKLETAPEDIGEAIAWFSSYPNVANAQDELSLRFVDGIMSNQEERGDFLKAVATLHGVYRRKNAYHPIWLTTFNHFEGCLRPAAGDAASRWTNRVGISTEHKAGQWVILFFPASQLELHRPTVLDGATDLHFPTPEGIPAAVGGLSVDLEMDGLDPASEYIAMWPSLADGAFDLEHCAQLTSGDKPRLAEIRTHHVGKLRHMFSEDPVAMGWLARVQKSQTAEN